LIVETQLAASPFQKLDGTSRLHEFSLGTLFFLLGSRVIYFDASTRLQGTQNLVAAGNHLVTVLHTLGNFNIGYAADSGIDGYKLG